MKVVLDTNCLLNIIFPQSFYRNVWNAFRNGAYTLCVTNEILSEYREIIERRTSNEVFADIVIQAILCVSNIEKVAPSYRFNLIKKDPDDNKFVDCAIACGASFIVSNDKHFKELDTIDWPKIPCIKLVDFVKIINS